MNVQDQDGFTLLEVAIVLAIIGLVVGAILVGQDLVRAAGVRQEVKDLVAFDTAFHAFRLKYNAVPGDFDQAGAIAGVPDTHLGDGDGMIDNGGFTEGVFAWEHLSKAGLLEGSFTGEPDPTMSGVCLRDVTCPRTPFNGKSAHAILGMNDLTGGMLYASTFASSNENAGIVALNGSSILSATGSLRVLEAYAVDTKLDDGVANSGRLLTANQSFAAGNCIDGAPSGSPDNPDGSSVSGSYDYLQTSASDDCWMIYVLRQ